PVQATYSDRDLEKALKASAGVSSAAYRSMVEPGCRLSKQIGNTYAASVFANIVCLACAQGAALEGQTALVFSYGSGAVATMYELHFRDTAAATSSAPASTSAATIAPRFSVSRIAQAVDLAARLADRECLPPVELDAALAARSDAHALAGGGGGAGGGEGGFIPGFPVDRLFPGAFYLEGIGGDRTRSYSRRPKDAVRARGGTLAPSLARKAAAGGGAGGSGGEEEAATATTASGTEASVSGEEEGGGEGEGEEEEEEEDFAAASASAAAATPAAAAADADAVAVAVAMAAAKKAESAAAVAALSSPLTGIVVEVGPGARLGALLPRVVVTGVACGLPGQDRVFEEDNLARLLGGQGCVQRLSGASVAALVEKNVVQVKRQGGGQPPLRIPITKASQTIKLAATLGGMDMEPYGVSASIAATMDKAVKVSVVAGLEALRDAGIVTGEGEGRWTLPGHMRDTTGVMYASSYPALDAAIGEVMRFLRSRCITRAKKGQLVAALRKRLRAVSPTGSVSSEDDEALSSLEKV
ncbi:unnamed protein product, partial [Laminaria digitata]